MEREVSVKRVVCMLAAAALAAPAFGQVSVTVGQPGFYGRIDVGALPSPRVMYTQPIVITPAPIGVVQQPIYLRVPPGHARHWSKYCARYNACGVPVYFVQDSWYRDVYVPYYRRTYVAPPPAYVPPPPPPRYHTVSVASVHAVMGPPEQRCWVERQQVVEKSSPNVPGAIVGGVIGGLLGHQVGGGRGKDVATVGGVVAGAAVGANVGRSDQVVTRDVQRCTTVHRDERPAYWDVSYRFRGQLHYAQFSSPPGRTIIVDDNGIPRQS